MRRRGCPRATPTSETSTEVAPESTQYRRSSTPPAGLLVELVEKYENQGAFRCPQRSLPRPGAAAAGRRLIGREGGGANQSPSPCPSLSQSLTWPKTRSLRGFRKRPDSPRLSPRSEATKALMRPWTGCRCCGTSLTFFPLSSASARSGLAVVSPSPSPPRAARRTLYTHGSWQQGQRRLTATTAKMTGDAAIRPHRRVRLQRILVSIKNDSGDEDWTELDWTR